MVLQRAAVERFLQEQSALRDSDLAKRAGDADIERALKRSGAVFVTEPYRHQKICYLLGWQRGSYLFLLGMGSGKTKISLDLARNLIRARKAIRALVLVPGVTNIDAWCEEARLHAPDLSTVGITMPGRDARTSALLSAGQVVIMTYQGLAALVCDCEPPPEGKRKGRWVLNKTRLAEIARAFDMAVWDECTAIKSAQSLWFSICRQLARRIPHRFGLTGTPFDKNPVDLWSQFMAVDLGEALGTTLGLFRSAYFSAKPRYWGGTDYVFRERLRENLSRRLRHSSIRFREEECQDLPECVGGLDGTDWMLRPVVMPEENRAYYERLLEDLEHARENFVLLEGVYNRMRMLASGFLGVTDGEGERVQITFERNPKLDALVELLSEIPEEEKVVVVNVFRHSSDLICARLKQAKIGFSRVYGPTKDKPAALAAWKDGGARVLVGSKTIAYGLNLQRAARNMVFYESPDSTIDRRQIERRIRRQGQMERCRYWDIVVRGSVEMRILKALRGGKRLLDLLIDRRVSAGELMRSMR